jgi:branched-chain amino acid transport system substrate-binding protein
MKRRTLVVASFVAIGFFFLGTLAMASAQATGPIRIGLLLDTTGFLEYFAKEGARGFELGIKYATNGTSMIKGRPIQILKEDTQLNPQVARQKAQKLLDQDKVHFLVGTISSPVTLAFQPLAEEFKVPLIVSGATATSITGSNWNPYTFRVNRMNIQDAVAWGAALGEKGRRVAIFSEDTAGGHEGMDALKGVLKPKGAEVVYEAYAPQATTDFTPLLQKVVAAKPAVCTLWWAGANNPWKQMVDAFRPAGIKISTAMLDLISLALFKDATDLVTNLMAFYYYEWHNNDINKWFIKEYRGLYGSPPTYSTEVGMAAAMLIVEGLKKTGADTDPKALISAMEGMRFDTAKGQRTMRAQDHQALQEMYTCHLEKKAGYDLPVPILDKVISAEDSAPPVLVKR